MNALRVKAVLHYQMRTGKRSFWLMIGIVSVLLVVNLLIPLVLSQQTYSFMDYSDGGAFAIYLMVILFISAHSDARFLSGQTVSRTGIWVGQLLYMLMLCAAFATARTLLAVIGYYATSALAQAMPMRYSLAQVERVDSFRRAFLPTNAPKVLLDTFLDMVLGGLFTYCYACFFRRWRGLTITLSIAIPALLVVTLVMPFWYEALNVYDQITTDSNAAMVFIMRNMQSWIDFLTKVADFIQKYWDIIIWSAAACTLPISWLVMRKTRQP